MARILCQRSARRGAGVTTAEPSIVVGGRAKPLSLAVHLALGSLAAGGLLFASGASAQEAADGEAMPSLPAVTVTATPITPEDLPPPAPGGQVATGGRLGLMGNVDVMDTPFNVTSYTAQLIEDQQARTLADVLANDPSVRFTTSNGHAYENFRIRGFDVNQNDVAINGMFGLLPVGHIPVEFLERVEVLRGPSALFSGMAPSGAVGGTINLVPKRAGDDPLTRLTVGYQSESQLITDVDVGRRFGEDKSLGLRINGAFSDGETDLEGQSKKREFLSGALDYRNAALKASLDVYSSRESFSGGTPAMFWFAGTSIPGAPDPAVNQFPGASGTLDSKGAIVRADYAFNAKVSAFAGAGFMNNVYAGFINGTHVRSIDANGTSTSTLTSAQRGYNDSVSSEVGVRAKFDTGSVAHEVVLQASNLEQEAGSANTSSPTYTTNIYDPVFRAMPALPALTPKTSESTLTSVALVDTLSFMADKVRLTVGLRNQTIKTTNFNAAGVVTGAYDKSVVTPAVAVVVKPWKADVSLYANYVQGLSKGDSVSTPTYAYNYTFAPYKTEQKELGVKWNAAGFGNTLALFEITKPTLITLSGNVPSDGGEKRVRGVEWNTFGEVVRRVRLLGGVAYTEGIQTKTANDQYNGNEAVGAPRWQGNLGMEWDPVWVTGLTLSGRVVASSGQYLNAANTQRIPGWSEFEIGARYAMQVASKRLVWRFNVVNLFDRHYYSGAFSDTTPIATLGQGRTVMASATIDL
ncbi:MAG: TonB-dependent siderophore receptor [Rhodocyclaceae bacterium]